MTKPKAPLPSMDDLVAFLNVNQGKVGKREIARAFHVRGDDRAILKNMLRELKDSGKIEKASGKKMITADGLPEQCPCEITGSDSDGELIARPLNWNKPYASPQILITDLGRLRPPPAEGDLVVLKLTPKGKKFFHGAVLRRLSEKPGRLVGLFESLGARGGRITSVDRRLRQDYFVDKDHIGGAKTGDVVTAEIIGSALNGDRRHAKIVAVVGKVTDPKTASLIALHLHAIPVDFSPDALKQAQKAKLPDMNKRADLRSIPLVTIDGEDARDFDDAVFAEPDDDHKNKDGWKLIVAIADVAFFVRPDEPLDIDARDRGNSVYFPDRCVPMLPSELSTDLCSLKPNADRPCVAAHLKIDKNGKLLKYKFTRSVMRSAARLNYHEVQDVFDGKKNSVNDALRGHLHDIYGAYKVLEAAREKRHALDLDVIEREIHLDSKGNVTDVRPRERLDSHKAVEEFMILANVAAAQALEDKGIPAMYRVHEPPSPEKADALGEFLKSVGIKAPKNVDSQSFNKILGSVKGTTKSYAVNQVVLRSQSQARYSPENLGHFGLALEKYAHFTSPIRRYADLLVHRGLISAFQMGTDGLIDSGRDMTTDMESVAEHISATERRADAAERDAEERYLCAYLKDRVGERFTGIVNGVSKVGLFVTVADIGAEGLIPVSTLPNDYYVFEDDRHRLFGTSTGNVYELGERVNMVLAEAVPVTGGLIFHILDAGSKRPAKPARKAPHRPHGNKNRSKNRSGKKVKK